MPSLHVLPPPSQAVKDYQTVLGMAPGESKQIAAKVRTLSKQLGQRG